MAKETFLSRRQILKISAGLLAGLTVLERLLSSPADADDVPLPLEPETDTLIALRPVLDPLLFPNELLFPDGSVSVRDQTRLLLFFTKQPHSVGLLKESVAKLVKPAGLILEDYGKVGVGETSLNLRPVNHGPRRFWVRSRNGRPITRRMLKTLDNATGGKLERIGPAYQSPAVNDRSGLYCPLPHVLVVKVQPGISDKDLREFLASFNLLEFPDISIYLNGYRYLLLRDEDEPTVYDLYQRFIRQEKKIIQNALFDIMPLISPLASSHSPGDYQYPKQWSMLRIAAGSAVSGSSGWEISQGNGVIVAIVDKGCDLTHPDLHFTPTGPASPNSGATFDFPPIPQNMPRDWCLPGDCPGPDKDGGPANTYRSDDYMHGTRMAGIIAALHNNNNEGIAGVAGLCSLMSLKATNSSIAERAVAIAYAEQNGAKVINYSMAEGPDTWNYQPYDQWKLIIDSIIQSAAGVAVICAATGNNASNDSFIGYPAKLDKFVMACGASQGDIDFPANTDKRRDFSQFGAGLSVVAPGENIVSTTTRGNGSLEGTPGGVNQDYDEELAGTSEATAHVSGLAAMLVSAFPSLGPRAIRTVIERTADKVHPTTYSYRYRSETLPSGALPYPNGPWHEEVGYGRINCHHALTFSDVYIKDYSSDAGDEPSSPPAGENFWSTSGIAIRPTDDGVFLPDDPLQSSLVTPGQDNVVYVQVINRGPAPALNFTVKARLVRYAMTEFTLDDWTRAIDAAADPTFAAEHIELNPLNASAATFSNVAANSSSSMPAKFVLPSAHIASFFTNMWHPCILAHVDCATDYASHNHREFATTSPQVLWLNNFAQRNVTITDVQAGQMKKFLFKVGNPARTSARIAQAMDIVIERTIRHDVPPGRPAPPPLSLPKIPSRLVLDVDRSLFPTVESLAPLEATVSRRREMGTLPRPRSFDFDGSRETFRIAPLTTDQAALSLETEIPSTARPGQLIQTNISQRNRKGEVVGGVTVIYRVTQ